MYFICNCKFDYFSLIGMATWTMFTCVMFLPAIHKRYAYPVDILMIVLLIVNKKYLFAAIPELINSYLSYGRYLFNNFDTSSIIAYSYISLLVYLTFTIVLFVDCKRGVKNSLLQDIKQTALQKDD